MSLLIILKSVMKLINNSKNKLNSKIIFIFNWYPNKGLIQRTWNETAPNSKAEQRDQTSENGITVQASYSVLRQLLKRMCSIEHFYQAF